MAVFGPKQAISIWPQITKNGRNKGGEEAPMTPSVVGTLNFKPTAPLGVGKVPAQYLQGLNPLRVLWELEGSKSHFVGRKVPFCLSPLCWSTGIGVWLGWPCLTKKIIRRNHAHKHRLQNLF
jgi:hypothetical protein